MIFNIFADFWVKKCSCRQGCRQECGAGRYSGARQNEDGGTDSSTPLRFAQGPLRMTRGRAAGASPGQLSPGPSSTASGPPSPRPSGDGEKAFTGDEKRILRLRCASLRMTRGDDRRSVGDDILREAENRPASDAAGGAAQAGAQVCAPTGRDTRDEGRAHRCAPLRGVPQSVHAQHRE